MTADDVPEATASGEQGLIERIIALLGEAAASDIVVPPGDDAAVWRSDRALIVATTDALAEGVHWRPDTMSLGDVGWRTVASNVSDLAAMGATPRFLLVSAVLGPTMSAAGIDEFAGGLADACNAHGVRVAGGDVTRGASTAFSVAALGEADDAPPLLRRDAARVGDAIAVSGTLGAAAAGLAAIEAGLDGSPEAQPLLRAHRRPLARPALGQAARAAGVRCGIDLSDGLARDLGHIARMSGAGIEVDLDALPLEPAAASLLGRPRALDLALGGGEDYELALAGDRATLEALGTDEAPVRVIGQVVEAHAGEVWFLDGEGRRYDPPMSGWDPFAAPPESAP